MVTPTDIGEEPMVSVTRRFSARARLERAFADHGVEPRTVLESGTIQFLLEMVRARLGIAVINPFPIAYVAGSGLVFRPFEPLIEYETSFLFPAVGGATFRLHDDSSISCVRSRCRWFRLRNCTQCVYKE